MPACQLLIELRESLPLATGCRTRFLNCDVRLKMEYLSILISNVQDLCMYINELCTYIITNVSNTVLKRNPQVH